MSNERLAVEVKKIAKRDARNVYRRTLGKLFRKKTLEAK